MDTIFPQQYDPLDWFWIVGSDYARAWSSAAGTYVHAWPLDRVTRIPTETALRDVLKPYGLPSPIVTADDYAAAIDDHIDAVARSRQYRDADRLASYVNSTNTAWSAEARAFVAWRDSVLRHAYEQFAAVQGGARTQPTIAGMVSELPTISWP